MFETSISENLPNSTSHLNKNKTSFKLKWNYNSGCVYYTQGLFSSHQDHSLWSRVSTSRTRFLSKTPKKDFGLVTSLISWLAESSRSFWPACRLEGRARVQWRIRDGGGAHTVSTQPTAWLKVSTKHQILFKKNQTQWCFKIKVSFSAQPHGKQKTSWFFLGGKKSVTTMKKPSSEISWVLRNNDTPATIALVW